MSTATARKVYGIAIYTDAETFLLEALRGSERNVAEYYLDQIITECYDAVGCWDIAQVDTDTFWDIVRANTI